MLTIIECLPVELVGMKVLGYLSLRDIVMLERASGSKKSHQLFLSLIPYCLPIFFPSSKLANTSALDWFIKRRCKIKSLILKLPYDDHDLLKNMLTDYFDIVIPRDATIKSFTIFGESNISDKVRSVYFDGYSIEMPLISLIVQTCLKLICISLISHNIDDSAVIAIAQHCPKLETLVLAPNNITWTSLLALPLKLLDILSIPNIPTANIARRCSHALSRISYLSTEDLHQNGQDASVLIPYMTGLTRVSLYPGGHFCVPLLTQYCNKLTEIEVCSKGYSITDILTLCRANPLFEELYYYSLASSLSTPTYTLAPR